MHFDSPKKGTLETILFSRSSHAVFAAKSGDISKIVKLDAPTLIMLDSKRMLHAATKNMEEAQKRVAS